MFIQFANLPPVDCRPRVQPVCTVSEPTFRGQLARGAASLYSFWTYLQGIICLGFSLFIQFSHLPPGNCHPGVKSVLNNFSTYLQGCSARYAASLCSFWTYLQGIICLGFSLFIQFSHLPPGNCQPGVKSVLNNFSTYLQGTVGKGCNLVLRFLNQTSVDCRPGVQTVYIVSIPSSEKL